MTTVKHTARKADEHTHAPCTPRISLGASRWGSRPTRPRLVTFSWGAVTLARSRR